MDPRQRAVSYGMCSLLLSSGGRSPLGVVMRSIHVEKIRFQKSLSLDSYYHEIKLLDFGSHMFLALLLKWMT